MARAVELMPRIDEVLVGVQRDLFSLGALLATPDPDKVREHLEKARIGDSRIEDLERAIDDGESELEPLRAFILPGGTPKAATLHVARTICRRAERDVIAMSRTRSAPADRDHLPEPALRSALRARARRQRAAPARPR